MKRRAFLASSSLAGAAVLSGVSTLDAQAGATRQEYYEWRLYELPIGSQKGLLNDYLSKAAIPAWNRLGIKPVGVFTVVSGANDLLLHVLIPHPDLESFQSTPARLAGDAEYQKAAAPFLSASIDSPAYTRYESWLLRAFKNVPRVRVPAETAAKGARLFELRIYESPSDAAAQKKLEMFNEGGEIALFDRIGLRSVFFGETVIGRRQPNLVYLTVHADMAAREKAWDTFRNDEGWKALSKNPAYANTVTARVVTFLRPADCSQI